MSAIRVVTLCLYISCFYFSYESFRTSVEISFKISWTIKIFLLQVVQLSIVIDFVKHVDMV